MITWFWRVIHGDPNPLFSTGFCWGILPNLDPFVKLTNTVPEESSRPYMYHTPIMRGWAGEGLHFTSTSKIHPRGGQLFSKGCANQFGCTLFTWELSWFIQNFCNFMSHHPWFNPLTGQVVFKEFPFTIEPKQLELEVGETKELSVSCFPVTWQQKKSSARELGGKKFRVRWMLWGSHPLEMKYKSFL